MTEMTQLQAAETMREAAAQVLLARAKKHRAVPFEPLGGSYALHKQVAELLEELADDIRKLPTRPQP